jgi:hypothetical protein
VVPPPAVPPVVAPPAAPPAAPLSALEAELEALGRLQARGLDPDVARERQRVLLGLPPAPAPVIPPAAPPAVQLEESGAGFSRVVGRVVAEWIGSVERPILSATLHEFVSVSAPAALQERVKVLLAPRRHAAVWALFRAVPAGTTPPALLGSTPEATIARLFARWLLGEVVALVGGEAMDLVWAKTKGGGGGGGAGVDRAEVAKHIKLCLEDDPVLATGTALIDAFARRKDIVLSGGGGGAPDRDGGNARRGGARVKRERGGVESRRCHICGKTGHIAVNCRSPKEAGKDKGKLKKEE